VERAIRTHSNGPLTSHAAQEAIFTLLVSLFGLSLTAGALFINRNPLLYFGVIISGGILFFAAAAMLARWFRKYGRRRSRHGQLARGQVPAMFASMGLLLQGVTFFALLILSSLNWRGF
jgi:uncharacterized membrane protein YraQ (UPF0718 family)